MKLEETWQEFMTLPPDAQREVADFIAFLKQRYPHSVPPIQAQHDWQNEPFIGIWKHRDDLGDSTEWVRSTRHQEWES